MTLRTMAHLALVALTAIVVAFTAARSDEAIQMEPAAYGAYVALQELGIPVLDVTAVNGCSSACSCAELVFTGVEQLKASTPARIEAARANTFRILKCVWA